MISHSVWFLRPEHSNVRPKQKAEGDTDYREIVEFLVRVTQLLGYAPERDWGFEMGESKAVGGANSSETTLASCASLCKLLGVGTRLEVLVLIAAEPTSVSGLAECLGLECSLLSHHLRALRDADLVDSVQRGHHRVYRLAEGVRARTTAPGRLCLCLTITIENEPVLQLTLPVETSSVNEDGTQRPDSGVVREVKPPVGRPHPRARRDD